MVSGNINDDQVPCGGTQLVLGYKTDSHFLSLLPGEHSRVADPPPAQSIR